MKKNFIFPLFLSISILLPCTHYLSGLEYNSMMAEILSELDQADLKDEEFEEFFEFLQMEGNLTKEELGIVSPASNQIKKVKEKKKSTPVFDRQEEQLDLKTLFISPPMIDQEESSKVIITPRLVDGFTTYSDDFLTQLNDILLKVGSYKLGIDTSEFTQYSKTIEKIEPAFRTIQKLNADVPPHENPYLKEFYISENKDLRQEIVDSLETLSTLNKKIDAFKNSEEDDAEYNARTKKFINLRSQEKQLLKNDLISVYSGPLTMIAKNLDELIASKEVVESVAAIKEKIQEEKQRVTQAQHKYPTAYGGPSRITNANSTSMYNSDYGYDNDHGHYGNYSSHSHYDNPSSYDYENYKKNDPKESPDISQNAQSVTTTESAPSESRKDRISQKTSDKSNAEKPNEKSEITYFDIKQMKKEVTSILKEILQEIQKAKKEDEKMKLIQEFLQESNMSTISDYLRRILRAGKNKKEVFDQIIETEFEKELEAGISFLITVAKNEIPDKGTLDAVTVQRERKAAARCLISIITGKLIKRSEIIVSTNLKQHEKEKISTLNNLMQKEFTLEILAMIENDSRTLLASPMTLQFKEKLKNLQALKDHTEMIEKLGTILIEKIEKIREKHEFLTTTITELTTLLHLEKTQNLSDEEIKQITELAQKIALHAPEIEKDFTQIQTQRSRLLWQEGINVIAQKLSTFLAPEYLERYKNIYELWQTALPQKE